MRPDIQVDRRFMAAALRLGRWARGLVTPNPAVGALLVRFEGEGTRIVGRGMTQPPGGAHAERAALAEAGDLARGATLYTTLEPCSHFGRTAPCADTIVAAGVARVVTALEDPNPVVRGRGHARLHEAGIEVTTGVLGGEAERALAGHLARMRTGGPHVQLKLAVSRDGKIGGAGRTRIAITGEAALAHTHVLRAEADAVLVGIGTVLSDDPLLTVRLPGLEHRSPVRIVLDSRLATPASSRLVASADRVPLLVIAGEEAPAWKRLELESRGVTVLTAPTAGGRIDPRAVLGSSALSGFNRLLIEGGARVAGSFIAADLVREVLLYEAPQSVGTNAVDALEPGSLARVTSETRFSLCEERRLGRDHMRVYWRA